MSSARVIRLFRDGGNQALRIPREFELPADEAVLRKEGNRLIVEPTARRPLIELLATWEPLGEEFPNIVDSCPEPVNL